MTTNHKRTVPNNQTDTFIGNALATTLEGVTFVCKRIPNPYEMLYVTTSYAGVLVLLGSMPYKFEGSPTQKSFIRDGMRLPGVTLAVYKGLEMGSIGFKYDVGNLAAPITKVTCKGIILVGTAYFSTSLNALGIASITSNFVCEIPARTLILTSRAHQSRNSSLSYFEFMWDNLYEMSENGIKQAIPKTFSSDVLTGLTLSSVFKYIEKTATVAMDVTTTKICLSGTGASPALHGQVGVYNQIGACFVAGGSITTKLLMGSGIMIFDFIFTTAREVINSLLFIPIVQSIADGFIPDWLFGSLQKTTTSFLGIATGIGCHATAPLGPLACIATGATVKVLLDEITEYAELPEVVGEPSITLDEL